MKNINAILVLLFCLATGCAPEEFNDVMTIPEYYSLRYDFSEGPMTVAVENLNQQQIQGLASAIGNTNMAVGFEVFRLVDGKAAKYAHAKVTNEEAEGERTLADTQILRNGCKVRMNGKVVALLFQHELLHCVLGASHSTDPHSSFYSYYRVDLDQKLTDEDIAKLHQAREKGLNPQ